MSDRVLTWPNLISLVRLACVPVFLYLLWGAERPAAAAWLLAVLGATDWVDGWIARRYDQGSELGKILDPTADRALLVAGAVALLVEDLPGIVHAFIWIVLVREIVIALVTVGLAVGGARRIDVVWAGKAGTLAVMFSLPMLLLAHHLEGACATAMWVGGWGFGIGGIGLGYYAAAQYVPEARRALREGRAARQSIG
jgi:cardiolipin synthase (CMP-forming)